MKIIFTKMNGAGNDFVVIDNRCSVKSGQWTVEQVREICSRNNAITKGCDQLLVLEKSQKADVFMRIYNADGGQVDACGNATRCIADMLYKELGRLPVTIETNVAILSGLKKEKIEDAERILVDMGEPKFDWQDIPLAMPIEQASTKIKEKFELENPIFVSMGNPHVVFFMDELPSDKEVAIIGSQIENFTEVFPERVNVSFAKLLSDDNVIYAKVWERGAGLTKACGTGACAMLAAANKYNDYTNNSWVWFENSKESVCAHIENNHILLGGKVEVEFEDLIEL